MSLPKDALSLADLSGHTPVIVGVGREGLAMARKLATLPRPPRVMAVDGSDGAHAEAFREEFGGLIELFVVDSDDLPPELSQATLAVMSPGISPQSDLHRRIRALGIPLTSGSALFVADHRDHMVGVTGSKGKSTTTTLIHALLEGSGVRVGLGGNMGIPLQGLEESDFYAVELSSYQCHYLEASPGVVALTALFPEHLDWHGSCESYYADKLNIAGHQPRRVIAHGDDDTLREEILRRHPDLAITWVGSGHEWHLEDDGEHSWLCRGDRKLFHTGSSVVLGRHNHLNMLIAVATADATGLLDYGALETVLSEFRPLAHRLETISDPSGIVFVNDSLATNPQAASAALRSLSSPGMVWIVGGQDRGVDYQPLVAQVLESKPRHILGIPGSGEKLIGLFRSALEQAGSLGEVHLESVESMEQAVGRARELARPGDYVLLSPAAPSFGQYRDYQHRAEDFINCIRATSIEERT